MVAKFWTLRLISVQAKMAEILFEEAVEVLVAEVAVVSMIADRLALNPEARMLARHVLVEMNVALPVVVQNAADAIVKVDASKLHPNLTT